MWQGTTKTGSTGKKVKSLIDIHPDEIVDSDGIPIPPKSMVELASRLQAVCNGVNIVV